MPRRTKIAGRGGPLSGEKEEFPDNYECLYGGLKAAFEMGYEEEECSPEKFAAIGTAKKFLEDSSETETKKILSEVLDKALKRCINR